MNERFGNVEDWTIMNSDIAYLSFNLLKVYPPHESEEEILVM